MPKIGEEEKVLISKGKKSSEYVIKTYVGSNKWASKTKHILHEKPTK